MMKKALISVIAAWLAVFGVGCSDDEAEKQAQAKPAQVKTEHAVQKKAPAKPAVKKPAQPKTNKYCEMKGEEFIQKDRDGRREVILGCLPDYKQKDKIYDVEKVLNTANSYFTTSESWEAPVTKFLDDYVAGKIKVNY